MSSRSGWLVDAFRPGRVSWTRQSSPITRTLPSISRSIKSTSAIPLCISWTFGCPYFRRLRRDAQVHYCAESPVGPFWSVTTHRDIIDVEVRHRVFASSSALRRNVYRDRTGELELPMFIAMDPPKHEAQRKVVQPIVSPENLDNLKDLIRSRIRTTLDDLPIGETFDWVDRVSVELTAQMLATLFDFPFEDRRKLSFWSDVSTALPYAGTLVESEEHREQIFRECLGYFMKLWNERVNAEPRPDLISMLAHGEATRAMSPREYLGNVLLLIVGGNDTTRNSMSGSVLFLSQNRRSSPSCGRSPGWSNSMVPEIIRYQTPISYMRRTALEDAKVGDKTIRKGDKVAMWYISGNRDEEAIEEPERFIIDRPRPRQHLSFGFGIHRCVGKHLAELQLKILWEEILQRGWTIEVVGEPKRVFSSFIHGFTELPARIAAAG